MRKGVDPKTALELQGLNLDNQIKASKLANGPELPDAIQSLQWRAKAAGLQPGSPEYQKFMATGGDKQSLVTVNTGNGEKFDEKLAELDAKAIGDVDVAGRQAIRNIGRINQLDQLLKASPNGLDAAWRQRAGEWGINTQGLDTLQAAQAAINSLVPEQRPAGSGPMSDADLELFKQSLPRTINQPGGNDLIINTMKGIAQYDAQGASIIQRLRAKQISREEAFRLLNERPNPLDEFKASQAGATQSSGEGWSDLGNGVKIRRKQ